MDPRPNPPYLMSDAEGFVDAFAPNQWNTGNGAAFAAVEASTELGVGSIVFVVHDRSSRVAEAGYWMSREVRGRGLTPRALRLMSEWTLREGGVTRLELLIEETNMPSRRGGRAFRYSLEGIMRQKIHHRGQQRDVALYARTR